MKVYILNTTICNLIPFLGFADYIRDPNLKIPISVTEILSKQAESD